MEIILAKNSGFCGGVANTVNKAQKYLINNQKAYILGDIVHNEQVIEELQKMGLIKINDVSEINSGTMIIRAHGEKKDVYDVLLKKKIKSISLIFSFLIVILIFLH